MPESDTFPAIISPADYCGFKLKVRDEVMGKLCMGRLIAIGDIIYLLIERVKVLAGENQSLKVRCSELESLKLIIESVEGKNGKLMAEVMNLTSKQKTGKALIQVNNKSVAEIKFNIKHKRKNRSIKHLCKQILESQKCDNSKNIILHGNWLGVIDTK